MPEQNDAFLGPWPITESHFVKITPGMVKITMEHMKNNYIFT